MLIKNKYPMEGFVYLKTDPEQLKRQIVGITPRPGGSLEYQLAFGDNDPTFHWECELSDTEDVELKTSN
jgi:hypothetical protein